ncbi:MAG TPA: hypothetical protein VF331_27575, partial [Polyangiales bacterium]
MASRAPMPSQLHEALLFLFRNRPELAPELLRDALDVQLPHYTEVRIRSESLTEIQPAEYRADLVVLLLDDKPVLGVVVEVQLTDDDRKRFAWPVYAVGLRARIKCPVCLFVFTHNDAVARWCAKPIPSWLCCRRCRTGTMPREPQHKSPWPRWPRALVSTPTGRDCMLISSSPRSAKPHGRHCKPWTQPST